MIIQGRFIGNAPWSGADWRQALDYIGAGQIRHARDFFTSLDWWNLEPHRDWIRMEGDTPDMESLTDPHCAAKPGEIYVIYIPEGNNGKSIEIRNLAEKFYKAQWFNPRDGSSSNIGGGDSVSPNPAGKWDSPPVQDNEDWVLWLALA